MNGSKRCCVKCCKSDSTVPTICFPKNPERNKLWTKVCGYNENEIIGRKRICVIHFEKNDFYNRSNNRIELKSNIIPHRNLPTKEAIDWFDKVNQLTSNNVELKKQIEQLTDELENTKLLLRNQIDHNVELNRVIHENWFKVEFFSKYSKLDSSIKNFIENAVENQDSDQESNQPVKRKKPSA